MRKLPVVFLTLLVLTAFCGIGAAEETRTFVDDFGREVELPAVVDSVAPSGSLAQIVLYSFGPENFATIFSAFSDEQKHFIDASLHDLPVTGSMFGSKMTMNAEEIMALDKKIGIDVIIDLGEAKEKIGPQMDEMQEKTNVPFVFITQNTLDDVAQSYLTLGEMLGQEERGQELADYTGGIVEMYQENMEKIGDDKVSVIYVTEVDGNAVCMLGHNSYHTEILDGIANNVAPEAVSGSGLGDQYTMEDIFQMNPDYIIVAGSGYLEHDNYEAIMSSDMWNTLPAVKEGRVYEAPYECPWAWMGNPPASHRLISILWLGNLLYPEVFDYDVEEKIIEFYDVFYHYDMTEEELGEIMVYSKGTAESAASSPAPVAGLLAGLAAAGLFVLRRK